MPKLGLGTLQSILPLHQCSKSFRRSDGNVRFWTPRFCWQAPRKRRHTAHRIWTRLRQDASDTVRIRPQWHNPELGIRPVAIGRIWSPSTASPPRAWWPSAPDPERPWPPTRPTTEVPRTAASNWSRLPLSRPIRGRLEGLATANIPPLARLGRFRDTRPPAWNRRTTYSTART